MTSWKTIDDVTREYVDEYNRKITNKVLLYILRNDFFDCWTGDTTPLPSDKLLNTINAFLDVLKNYFLVPDGHDRPDNGFYIHCLSNRQIYCGSSAIELAEKGKFAYALHEFMDCIDNYGEAQRNEKAITPNEYAFYLGIATVFNKCLMKDKMMKEALT